MSKVVSVEDTDILIRDTETAIDRGRYLMNWWSADAADLKTFDIPIRDEHLVEIKAFFDTVESDSEAISVMGCLQTARFPMKENPEANEVPLEAFIKSAFATNARWSHPNGRPAGFGYEALLHKLKKTAQVKRFVNGTDASALDLSAVGSTYDWMMMRVDIYDFLRATPMKWFAGPLAKLLKEAAYVVTHEIFAAPVGAPPPGTVAECLFGYAFLPCACTSAPFGFGPGHFHAAIKQFRFSLLETGDLEIRLSFIVAPRSQKVLDLWGIDPVYKIVGVCNGLTLGRLGIKQVAHDWFDRNFLTVHGMVHHNLLIGMEDFWTGHRWGAG